VLTNDLEFRGIMRLKVSHAHGQSRATKKAPFALVARSISLLLPGNGAIRLCKQSTKSVGAGV
jgi:hypothetical protein